MEFKARLLREVWIWEECSFGLKAAFEHDKRAGLQRFLAWLASISEDTRISNVFVTA